MIAAALVVWAVIDPEDETPLGGVWTTQELAAQHCPESYVVLKIELDVDYLLQTETVR